MRLTRRRALALGAAGAAAPLALVQAARAADDKKQAIAAVALALRLEQTAVVAYEAIANSATLALRPMSLFREFRVQDAAHAQQLAMGLQQLGANASSPPSRAAIPGLAQVHDQRSAVAFAIALEERTIGAYYAAAPVVADANLLHNCVGAMGTDAQQLVVLRELAGEDPVPSAFERGSPR